MLYSIATLAGFSGFFMLYNTSRKVKFSGGGAFEKWLRLNIRFSKIAGSLLILLSFVLLVIKLGTGVGMLTAFLLLMTAAGLVIAIAPFQYLKAVHVFTLLVISFILEFLFF